MNPIGNRLSDAMAQAQQKFASPVVQLDPPKPMQRGLQTIAPMEPMMMPTLPQIPQVQFPQFPQHPQLSSMPQYQQLQNRYQGLMGRFDMMRQKLMDKRSMLQQRLAERFKKYQDLNNIYRSR